MSIPGFCNTNVARSRVQEVLATYKMLGHGALKAMKEGKIKGTDPLYQAIVAMGEPVQKFMDSWGWFSTFYDPCKAIEESERMLEKLNELGKDLGLKYLFKPESKWWETLIWIGAIGGAGYLAYRYFYAPRHRRLAS